MQVWKIYHPNLQSIRLLVSVKKVQKHGFLLITKYEFFQIPAFVVAESTALKFLLYDSGFAICSQEGVKYCK